MWFCLQYVMGLRPDDQIEEELADNMFGTILHAVFEKLYQPFENREVSRTALEELIKTLDDKLPDIIKQIPEYKLLDVLARQAVRTYTERILRYDMAHTPFTYMGAEAELIRTIDIADDGDNDDHLLVREIQLYGKIDRIDKNDGQLRVVDYKSGKQRTDEPKGWDSLFSKSSYTLQTLFYCYLLRERKPVEDILPCLYFMPNIGGDLSFDPSLKFDKQTLVYGGETETMFENLFKQCLREIADTGKMLEARPSSSNGYCTYCPFADICG
jgi:ATP-dependent helicase/DNAse subunit B